MREIEGYCNPKLTANLQNQNKIQISIIDYEKLNKSKGCQTA